MSNGTPVKKFTKDVTIPKTDEMIVNFGAFEIGSFSVPYMSSVLRAQQVSEYLHLVTDDPKYARQDWSIDELFQREVDFVRVSEIANQYLAPDRAERPPFFNSLTVVLMQRDEGSFEAPSKSTNFSDCISIGSITINFDKHTQGQEYPIPGDIGQIQWNRNGVYAVAIDGQHRLAAIKEIWKKRPHDATNLTVSVLFLILDKKIGLKIPAGHKDDPLSVMRGIFIDLNKTAVQVSKSRNILLDDYDPLALFIKSLLSPSLSYEGKCKEEGTAFLIGTNNEFKKCLPLNLVDWHGESKSKVDEGPYLVSILGLEWIVSCLIKNSKNPSRSLIDKLNKYTVDDEAYYEYCLKLLSTWEQAWEKSIKTTYLEAKDNDRPVILSSDDLRNLKDEFAVIFSTPIIKIFTNLKPYSALIKKRMDTNTLNPQFAQWYQAFSAYKNNMKRPPTIAKQYKDKLDVIEEELKNHEINIKKYHDILSEIDKDKNDSIFYFIVGQRAVFIAFSELFASGKFAEWIEAADKNIDDYAECPFGFYADYFVDAINYFYIRKPELFSKLFRVNPLHGSTGLREEFWAGSLTDRDDPYKMDFSEAAAKRGAKWLGLMVHLYWFSTKNKEVVSKDCLNDALQTPQLLKEYPLGDDLSFAIGRVRGTKTTYNDSPMGFLSGLHKNEFNHAIASNETKDRLHLLCEICGLK